MSLYDLLTGGGVSTAIVLLPFVENVKGKPITLSYFGDICWHLPVLDGDIHLQTKSNVDTISKASH